MPVKLDLLKRDAELARDLVVRKAYEILNRCPESGSRSKEGRMVYQSIGQRIDETRRLVEAALSRAAEVYEDLRQLRDQFAQLPPVGLHDTGVTSTPELHFYAMKVVPASFEGDVCGPRYNSWSAAHSAAYAAAAIMVWSQRGGNYETRQQVAEIEAHGALCAFGDSTDCLIEIANPIERAYDIESDLHA